MSREKLKNRDKSNQDNIPSLAEPPRFSIAEFPPSYENKVNGINPYLQAISDVKEIFDSGDPILIPAIQANLHAFKRAVKREQQFAQIIKENDEIKNRLSEIEKQFKIIQSENKRLKATYEGPNGNDGNLTNTNGTEM